jgi:hypothetical protein
VAGALVVPTMIAFPPSEESEENTPHPATVDMDTRAARGGRYRFRLNTRLLLEMPCRESAKHTAAPRTLNRFVHRELDHLSVMTL